MNRNQGNNQILFWVAILAVVVAIITMLFGDNLFERYIEPLLSEETSSPTNTPSQVTAYITFPDDNSGVGYSVIVEGKVFNLSSNQKAYLCIKSMAFGNLIFPQGEITPNNQGEWAVEGIYQSVGYQYETFVVVTENNYSMGILNDRNNKANGLTRLPEEVKIISSRIVLNRE